MRVIVLACLMLIVATPAFARHHRHHANVRNVHSRHHHEIASTGGILTGTLEIAGRLFDFVTGGAGRGRIPFGDWQITPDDVGPWGRKHGALGLNHGDDMPDPRYKRDRDGIEIHAAERHTAGCVGIKEKFKEFKALVLKMIESDGAAWLHIYADKQIVTATKVWKKEADASK